MLGFSMKPNCATTLTIPSHIGVTRQPLGFGDSRLLPG